MKTVDRLVAFALPVLLAGALEGAVKALDFEVDDEIRQMPRYNLDRMQTGTTNIFASSGRNSFFFRMRPWKKGEDQWPLFVLRTQVRDWSGYDRLSIDVVNLDEGGDTIGLSVSGPGVGDFAGLGASMTLGPCGVVRWTVPLDRWPEKMSVTNVTKIGFCVTRPGGCEVYLDNFTLLKPGEEASAPAYSSSDMAKIERIRKERNPRRSRFDHGA